MPSCAGLFYNLCRVIGAEETTCASLLTQRLSTECWECRHAGSELRPFPRLHTIPLHGWAEHILLTHPLWMEAWAVVGGVVGTVECGFVFVFVFEYLFSFRGKGQQEWKAKALLPGESELVFQNRGRLSRLFQLWS